MNTDSQQNGKTRDCYAASASDKVLSDISRDLAMAAVRKDQQAEIAAFLQKARSAADEYIVQKRVELVRRWSLHDDQIVDLVTAIHAIPDWTAGIEQVCPLYLEIGEMDHCLMGDGSSPDQPKVEKTGMYWTRAWMQENRDVKKRACVRARLDLVAWEKPAQSLDKILKDNEKLIGEAFDMLDKKDPALAFVLYFKLIPMHLLIKNDQTTSVKPLDEIPVGAKYKECVKVARSLLGPQPALIPPSEYYGKIEEVLAALSKAVQELADAEGALKQTEDAIARNIKQLEDKKKILDKAAREALQEASTKKAVSGGGTGGGGAGGGGGGGTGAGAGTGTGSGSSTSAPAQAGTMQD